MMKIAFVGLGSIGQRHLFNIAKVLKEKNIGFSIDALRQTKRLLSSDVAMLLEKEYLNLSEMPDDYDVVFITNPTVLHYETLQNVLPKTRHVFIEKPLFHYSDHVIDELPLQKDRVYYVACPLRYTKVIDYLKKFVDGHKVYSARSICSSYLPDWRANVDYRNSYSAKQEMGGGVSLDLIHEWDYISYLFGFPEKMFNFRGKYSQLEISSEDSSVYIAQYSDKLISLHLDYFGRKPTRQIELYCQDDVVVGDLISQQIRFLHSGEVLDFSEQRDDYHKRELEYFISLIHRKEQNHNDISYALRVLQLAEGTC